MQQSTSFHQQARDCRKMAAIAPNTESKADWLAMAERWQRLAEFKPAPAKRLRRYQRKPPRRFNIDRRWD